MDDAAPSSRALQAEVLALRQRLTQMEAAKDYAEHIVETIRDPLLVLTPDGRVQSANPAFYALFQLRAAAVEGHLIYQLDDGQWDIPELRTLLEEILPLNTVFNDYEVTQHFARLGRRTMLLNARRLDDVQLILLAMEDITDRKDAATLLEQRVQERTVALQQALAERQRLEGEVQRAQHFALLGRLAAGVAHEIRNPLAAIALQIELLEEELRQPSPDSGAAIPEAFTEIHTSLARLNDLVEDYLALMRVGTHRQYAAADLGRLVTQCLEDLTPSLLAAAITLHLETMESLGVVLVHANTFRRVLVNLVHNAIDAMPHGGTLTLQGRRECQTVSLTVRDTGVGIAAAQCATIFEPLYTTKPGGTGLGLYIVQEVITAHGGHVAVQSTVDHGTTFTITLPVPEETGGSTAAL
jgi:two-component system CheB/CheR fusion protein